jgi:hypothetical protein
MVGGEGVSIIDTSKHMAAFGFCDKHGINFLWWIMKLIVVGHFFGLNLVGNLSFNTFACHHRKSRLVLGSKLIQRRLCRHGYSIDVNQKQPFGGKFKWYFSLQHGTADGLGLAIDDGSECTQQRIGN